MSPKYQKLLVALLLLGLVLAPLLLVKSHMSAKVGNQHNQPILWEYTYDSPEHEQWKEAKHPRNPKGREGSHILWLRTKLPEGDWRDPALVIQFYHKFEMYDEDGLIYQFGDMSEEGASSYEGNPPRIISLPEDTLGERVWFKVYSNGRYIGLLNEPYVDSRAEIIEGWLREDTDQAIIGFIYIVFAFIGMYLQITHKGHRYFILFGIFTVLLGLNSISRLNVIYLYYDHSLFWKYFELISFYFGESCLVMFLANYFGGGWKGLLKKLWMVHLAYVCSVLPLNGLGMVSIPDGLILYQMLLVVSILVVVPQITYYAWRGNQDARVVMLGTMAMCFFGAVDLLDSILFGQWDLPSLNYIGLLYFILSLIFVLARRSFELRERIHNSEKLALVGQLAAGIAHEIRNPVTVLSGFLSIMQHKETQHGPQIDMMRSEVDRIHRIMSEFLMLAKPAEPIYQYADIGKLLLETKFLFEEAAYSKSIELKCELTPGVPDMICDAGQLKQVFVNLMKNAIEAMQRPGTILIELKLSHSEMIIRFADEGEGISKELLKHIGEPFFSTKSGGTGLGMMVSKRIIESHGGALEVFSRLGEGTRVEIRLPLKLEEPHQKD